MISESLIPAKLIRRYKRFLADVELLSGSVVQVHCPNPGSMIGLAEPGTSVWLRPASNPKRVLQYGWVLTELESALVCVDTLMANRIIADALQEGILAPFSGYAVTEREKTFADSRFDFRLSGHDSFVECLMEVKSVTLGDDARAMFPDAKTERGRKHLNCLMEVVRSGLRAAQVFCISRTDSCSFSPADHIDPLYGQLLRTAAKNNVELYAFAMDITKEENQFHYRIKGALPIELTDDVSRLVGI